LDAGQLIYKNKYTYHSRRVEEAIANVLESNDEVKMWFNDYCEYGDDFKCSKKELEDNISKPFREIQNEIQRITNFKYVRNLRIGKFQGGFKGFRIKSDCLVNDC